MSDTKIKGWITINGNHVPLIEGQSKAQSIRKWLDKRGSLRKAISNKKESNRKEYKGKMVVEGTKRYFQNEDGSRIDYLTTAEYNKLGDKLRDSLDEDERTLIQAYVDCPDIGGSCDLNTPDKYSQTFAWNLDKDNITTEYEWDKYCKEVNNKLSKAAQARTEEEKSKNPIMDTEKWAKENNIPKSAISHYSHNMQEINEKLQIKDIDTYIKHNEELRDLRIKERKELEKYSWKDKEYGEIKAKYSDMIDAKSEEYGLGKNRSDYYYQKNIDYYNKRNIMKEKSKTEFINTEEYMKRMKNGKNIDIQFDDLKARFDTNLKEQAQMDDIFNTKGITLDKDIIVLRRTREDYDELRKGFTKAGYVSTTMKQTLGARMPSGNKFGEEQVEIIIPKGTKILPLKSTKLAEITPKSDDDHIRCIKNVANQNEILLPRGTKFNYVSTWQGRYLGYGKGYETRVTLVADTSASKNYKYKSKKKVNGEWVYEY